MPFSDCCYCSVFAPLLALNICVDVMSDMRNAADGCRRGCLPSRCECVAALNYVRDRHGACIKITDCDVPSILIAFESREAFRKIFGKLYNEGEPEDGERPDSTKNHEYNTAKPPQHDVEGVHSYPPENLFPHAVTHSYPPELPTEDMGIHSYPPENRLHDVPVYRYSRDYRPRRTSSYGYPSYDLSEDEGVHSYPPEFPEEVGTHDYVPLPFISDYGNIASHQSGTFYYQLGKKGGKKQEHYDPYSPRRFEKAKVRSKLKESSILRQVPPEVRMTLRDIGGTASLRELANAKVLFEFQPDGIDQKLREGEDKPIHAWTSSPSATVAHTISPRTTTIQPRSDHFSDIAATSPEAATEATSESAYQEWSTGAPLSSYQRTTLSEGLEEIPSGSVATTTASSHSHTSTQRGSYKPSALDAGNQEPSVENDHEIFDCPCATALSLKGSNNVKQMTVVASTTTLSAEIVTESPLRTVQSSTTYKNEKSERTALSTPANHRNNGRTEISPSQKDTNNVTQATASGNKGNNNAAQATVEASATTPNPALVTESLLKTMQSSTTHENGTSLGESAPSTPTNHRSDGWTETTTSQKGTNNVTQAAASSQEGTNNAAQATVKAPPSTLNTTVISEPLEPTQSTSTHETGTSQEATLHPATEKHRSDGWAKTTPSSEGANNETQITVKTSATMQNTTNFSEPGVETRHPGNAPEYSTSQVPAQPQKHRNDGWTRPIFSRPNTNVHQSVAIVLPPSPSASNDEQFRLQYRKYAVSSHPSPHQSNRLSCKLLNSFQEPQIIVTKDRDKLWTEFFSSQLKDGHHLHFWA
ncbi:hypothetical protein TELCIR_01625 [Teladorsagia circumcincta]|uniref:Uncharacterized protein n=1 Tax=Teladorsagia circumcincta TaxID=45464 RepID=A0A2G9V1Q3_TELCI|nr:hypothetical protein TELCIR_01625 [Teladorsagia circumcincta]